MAHPVPIEMLAKGRMDAAHAQVKDIMARLARLNIYSDAPMTGKINCPSVYLTLPRDPDPISSLRETHQLSIVRK